MDSGIEGLAAAVDLTERTLDADMSLLELNDTAKLGAALAGTDGARGVAEGVDRIATEDDAAAVDVRLESEARATEETEGGSATGVLLAMATETLEGATALLGGTDAREGLSEGARVPDALEASLIDDGRAESLSVTAGNGENQHRA